MSSGPFPDVDSRYAARLSVFAIVSASASFLPELMSCSQTHCGVVILIGRFFEAEPLVFCDCLNSLLDLVALVELGPILRELSPYEDADCCLRFLAAKLCYFWSN